MPAEHAGDLLHRFDFQSTDQGDPRPQAPCSTSRPSTAPALGLLAGGILRESCLLTATHDFERIVEALCDTKRIEHFKGLSSALVYQLWKRLPHVRTHHAQPGNKAGLRGFEFVEPSVQGGLGASAANLEQTTRPGIDLVRETQEIEGANAATVMEFFASHGRDAGEVTMLEDQSDTPFDRSAHSVKTCREDWGVLLRGRASRQAGEKLHVGCNIRVLPTAPRHGFNGGLAGRRADHPARCAVEEDSDIQKRQEVLAVTRERFVNSAAVAATHATAIMFRVDVEAHVHERFGVFETVADRFDGEASRVLDVLSECFLGKLNDGLRVVCCVKNSSNAYGRHSQANSAITSRRILPRKAHAVHLALQKAAAKRTGDINARSSEHGRKPSVSHATPQLNGGEYRPGNSDSTSKIIANSAEEQK